jgi:sialate O-acetylesterase
MHLRRFLTFGLLFLLAPLARAEVKPHALFSDHMVLQRDQPLTVWGTASPGESVSISLKVKTLPNGEKSVSHATKADDKGKWSVKLDSFPAGREGTLSFTGGDGKTKKFTDILVGEVWICSGQSNMEWSLAASPRGGGPEAIKNSTNPNLRLFTVPKFAVPTPQEGFNPKPPNAKFSTWLPSTPENTPMFSAVGWFFGRDLEKALQVPVGLIHTSWGGTPAQAWTSTEMLQSNPALKYYPDSLAERTGKYDAAKAKEQYDAALAKWNTAVEEAKKSGKKAPNRPQMQAAPGTGPNDPASLYNGMIAPLVPFAVKGAIWYQGESNAGKPIEYRALYADMIRDWRKRWGNEFSFYCVQLAPFNAGNVNGDNWAYLREAQEIASRNVKSAGVAVITDVGDKDDIHPQKKEPAGARLALLALANTYGQKVEFSGPTFKSLSVTGPKAVVNFDHLGGGLEAKTFEMPGSGTIGDGGELVGFTLAGEDQVFHPAKATIVGDTVVLTSEKVAQPRAVRYGWVNFPKINLFNKAGIPASPFRSDDFPPPYKQ